MGGRGFEDTILNEALFVDDDDGDWGAGGNSKVRLSPKVSSTYVLYFLLSYITM